MSVLIPSKNPHRQAIGEDFSRRGLSFYQEAYMRFCTASENDR